MVIQDVFNALSEGNRNTRSQYHLTLGGLISALSGVPSDAFVFIDGTKAGIKSPHSYRGYYSDLSFEKSTEPKTVSETLETAKSCIECCFQGWKGGEYIMKEDTPLWIAKEGESSQLAIMDAKFRDGAIQLICKQIEL